MKKLKKGVKKPKKEIKVQEKVRKYGILATLAGIAAVIGAIFLRKKLKKK